MFSLSENLRIRLKPPELDHFIDAAFLGLICVVFTFNYAALGLTPVYLAFYAVFVGLNLLKVLLRIRLDGKLKIPSVVIWYMVFTGFAILSIWWTDYPGVVIDSMMRLLQIAVLLFAMSQTYGTPSGINRCLKMISAATTFMVLYVFINTPFDDWFRGKIGAQATGQNANFMGMILILSALITIYFAYYEKKRLYYFAGFLQILCTLLTGSRKSVLALCGGLVILVFLKDRSVKLLFRILAVGLGVGLIFYAIMEIPELYRAIGCRLESMMLDIMSQDEDNSMKYRQLFMDYAKQFFTESPLVGNGMASFAVKLAEFINIHTYSHNNYYEILSGLGIIGFVLYYWMYIYIIAKLINPVFINPNGTAKVLFVMMLVLMICEYGIVTYYSIYMPVFVGTAYLFVCSNDNLKEFSSAQQLKMSA